MSKRLTSLLCAGLFALAACGDTDDPSKNNGNNTANNANNVNNVNNANNVNNVNNTNNVTPNNTNNVTPNNTNNTNNVNPNNTNNTNNTGPCMLLEDFTGQVAGDGAHEGGTPDFNGTLTGDAGLQAVYDAAPDTSDDPDTMDVDEGRVEGLDIQVTDALVVATTFDMFANNTFWVQDGNLALRVRLDNGTAQPVNIAVGQRVSFGVEAVVNFGDVPQIAQFTGDVTVGDTGQAVPIREATGTPITIDDFGKLVRVWGTIEGPGNPCGGDNTCYDLVHGEGTQTTTFRTGSNFIEPGDCVTFVGPASAFPGPLADGGQTIQLDQTNFDWAFEPRN